MKSESKSYHHGDLRQALIGATEQILTERGLEGFSMREAARRAGVSPAAPAHHFGDARGLLTAVATGGFLDLQQALRAANAEGGDDRVARIRAQARAYIRFGVAHPARFDLMWRCEALNRADPAYLSASVGAFSLLHEAITGVGVLAEQLCDAAKPGIDVRAVAAWSLVHGFTTLARQGNFDPEMPGLMDGVLATLTV
ncbi:bacterial regulatory protein, tetR family protein [Asticcacaulis biprosthecium C19]|uniref:Bacterial regulatory protein, tetR family protein n=1 Tax=Asticcacaulis biprosthecium C19 TaxID=715226 RepID=F4QSK4_9CAUL|nr:TetR/AcrR family transcriptional regulator [Asticcacaulis biprosthecium]EGF89724.1 bacterial regulatory protein, tetR family protein [Asticcacaulis biprosthecium C19]